jgi:hypothetical protein
MQSADRPRLALCAFGSHVDSQSEVSTSVHRIWWRFFVGCLKEFLDFCRRIPL